ncbi:adenine/guanine phosphoribosyltransferase [Cenarchaeum symbiosum A]|uniref:Adenine phosphoribosyltransferase n=1 Tax=Cenarchaeum symbiosum (strain A) TaxID=414004 RepID=APT_CENSY|nr:RecName: Full=Adenine phosphoribosyltransferase; Short=APRT [Cenarchaeum symbiosum A]ABK77425.1 adenine/guanine phosphoribosyltransferase [Cenarchaeum symbiosum A]
MDLEAMLASYPDFPKKGVLFKDIGPILRDPAALAWAADELLRRYPPADFDVIAGIESRGFILATIMSARSGKGMVMIRKPGKLPGKTVKLAYKTEYGEDILEAQHGSVKSGERVIICDDLLATGGTAAAAASLVEQVGGKVAGLAFIVELAKLCGADKIAGYNRKSLVVY